MKRLGGLLVAGATVLAVAFPASAQPRPASPPPGGEVQAAIADLTNWIRVSGGGELVTSGPVTVTPGPAGDLIRLPGLTLRAPDAEVSFGDVDLVRGTGLPGGLWRLTGSLPTRVTVATPGLPAAVVSTGGSAFDVEIDPRNGMIGNARISASDAAVVFESIGRVAIAGIELGSDLRVAGDGKTTVTSTYRLDGLRVQAEPESAGAAPADLARAGSIASTVRLDGVDWDRLAELQTFALANQVALAAGDQSDLAKRFEALLTTPDLIADGVEVRFGLTDLWIGEIDGTGPVSLASGGFHVGVSGLTGASAGASIGYAHEGLSVLSPLPVDAAAMPEALAIEIAVERLPGARLIGVLGSGDDEERRMLAALGEAGTTARVTGARIRMNGSGADLDLELSASATAPDGVVGRADLSVLNLDRIVAALGPLVTDELAAIQLAAALGQRSEGAGGVTHRWLMARGVDGLTTLNGNYVSAIVGDGMAMLDSGADIDTDETEEQRVSAGTSAAFIAERLEEFGVATTVEPDSAGDPSISGALGGPLDGRTLGVQFFDCAADGVCDSAMLYLGLESGQPVPLARLNDWNRNERWVRAYRSDDGEVWLEMDVPGGVSAAIVDAAIERFLESAERFVDEGVAGR